jgi:putative transposase
MRRTNSFEVVPQSERADTVLRRLLDASASLWNQLTYARRQQFFAGESVWDCAGYYDEYVGVLGSATTQQITRVNDAAWRSFFETVEEVDQEVSPPGYWGNEADGRDPRTYIRNDAYTISWGERSRLEIPISSQLKDEYGFGRSEQLRVAVRGDPHWQGDQGRLHLTDDVDETYRAYQPVTVPERERATPTGADVAALDIGANVLVACTTTAGDQYWYNGQGPFRQFRETSKRIADAKAKLPEGQHTSKRIKRLYRKRSRRCDHAVNALLRDLVERFHDDGVETLYHGDLTGVLGEYWSVKANLKARTFWAHRQCSSARERLRGVRHRRGVDLRGVDLPDVFGVWGARTDPLASRDPDVSVWLRGSRRSRRVADAA